ncbi:MAG: hypothetical protein LBE82_02095 [Chitinophagaceae bacterium]|jgi:hypothetical protein|nr:hypothetical protein [Chitinophagaceae bacterium]
MKSFIKYIVTGTLFVALLSSYSHAQVRISIDNQLPIAPNGSAFIDASSTPEYNNNPILGKGLLFPRADLSLFTAFSQGPFNALPANYPTRYDGFIVYNTKVGGTAGVGNTQGTLAEGFWYYENKSATINGGTWKPLGGGGTGGGITAITGDNGMEVTNPNGPTVTINLPAGGDGGNTLVWNSSTNKWEAKASAASDWFYLPSFNLNISAIGNGKTVNLYDQYANQFNKSVNTTKFVSSDASFTSTATNRPLYAKTQLAFVVTDYDNTVIKVNSISPAGEMNYDVLSTTAKPTSFINIICVVR